MSNRNNTRELERQISKQLAKSDRWIVIRSDKQGLHLHTPSEDHISVLPEFLLGHPDLLDSVMKTMESVIDKAN